MSAPSRDDVALARLAAASLVEGASPELRGRLLRAQWADGHVEEGGQFHRVLVLPGVAVLRIARTAEAGVENSPRPAPGAVLARRMALLTRLAELDLPWRLPLPLSEVVEDGRATRGVLQTWVAGEPHPPHSGDPEVLRDLCDGLGDIDTEPLADVLGPPFAFRGPWTTERVATLQSLPRELGPLPDDWDQLVASLSSAVTTWSTDPALAGLVHGDLAGHNLRWLPPTDEGEWELHGILDWDFACVNDRALNPAYLSLWHVTDERRPDFLARVCTDADQARRAIVWLGAMSLESIDDAWARSRAPGGTVNLAKLLTKVGPRLAAAREALG